MGNDSPYFSPNLNFNLQIKVPKRKLRSKIELLNTLQDSDPTALYGVARGVMAIQSIYGVIPRVYGKGKAAQHVFNYMQSMRKELLGQEPEIVPQIDTAIIVDRQV